jgi:CheY-like chemotaxis protein
MARTHLDTHILVVDDDLYVRKALNRAFLNEDWQVTCASSGQEALDILILNPVFNVVVADYFMPQLNGLAFLERANRQYPHIYCIMLTSYPYCDAIKHLLNKTTNAVLLDKPWDERLFQYIRDARESQAQALQGLLA